MTTSFRPDAQAGVVPPHSHQGGGTALPRATVGLLLVCMALLPMKVGGDKPIVPADLAMVAALLAMLPMVPRVPAAARLGVYLLFGSVAFSAFLTFGSGDPQASSWAMVRFLGLGLLIVYFRMFVELFRSSLDRLRGALRILITSTALLNLALFPGSPVRGLLSSLFPQKWESRLSGGLYDPNANGALLAVCLVVALCAGREVYRTHLTRVGVVVVLTTGLALTLSRGAIVAGAAGLTFGALWAARLRARNAVLVLCSALAIVVVLASQLDVVDWITAQWEDRPASSFDNRLVYIERSVQNFTASPLFGRGLGAGTRESGAVTHATIFWLLGDSGIFAAIGYVTLIVAAFRSALQCPASRWRLTSLSALVTMCVASLSFEALYQRVLWVVLAMTFALPHLDAGNRTARAR